MNSQLLLFVILSSLITSVWGETMEFKFESNTIQGIKIESGSCELKTVDYSYCELINSKTDQVEKIFNGANCDQNSDLNHKLKENGNKKYTFKKTISFKTTSVKMMNILVEQEGSQTLIPFYSNQEAPEIATNSCDFPLTTEDHGLVADRAERVFKALARAKTVYRNQFDQCYIRNSMLEIHLMSDITNHNGPVPNKLFANTGESLGNKLVDCATASTTPLPLKLNDESCMVLKTEQGVRANCLTTADDIPERFVEAGECLEDVYASVTEELILKGYEEVTERWYVRKAKALEE